MSDPPKDDTEETPMQRALRLKKAALKAKPNAPASSFKREEAARMRTGASKPWMKR
jgi:hypothetical protein